MADHNDPRYRPNDPYAHAPEHYDGARHEQPQNDPLAELARLIGQTDPFSDTRTLRPLDIAPPDYHPVREYPRTDYDVAAPASYGSGAYDAVVQGTAHYDSGQYDSADYDRTDADRQARTGHDYDQAGYGSAGYDNNSNYGSTAGYDNAAYDARYHEREQDDRGTHAPPQYNYDHSPAAPQQGYAPVHQSHTRAQDDWPTPYVAPTPPPAYDPFAAPVHQPPPSAARHYDSNSYVDPRAAEPRADAHGFHARTFATQRIDAPPPEPQAHHGQAHHAQAHHAPAYDERSWHAPPPRPADPFAPSRDTAPYDQGQHGPSQDRPQDQFGIHAADRSEPDGLQPPPPFMTGGRQSPPDDFYDDEAPRRRSKGLVTVMAVLGLAVLGTAGAFAYRTLSGSAASGPAPVIRASTEPTKVVPPAPPANDPSSNKLTYDRFGDRSQNEQVVSREERPVDINSLVRASEPRVVLPGGPGARGTTPQQNGSAMAAAQPLPPNIIAEPKRVRSVPIRPDQPESATGRPAPSGPSQTPSSAMPRNSLAAAGSANAPLDVTPQASAASVRTAPTRPVQVPPANAPLSIAPDAAPQAAAPPQRIASAPAAPGGGFVVQVSSQRSEGDAQTAYRNIQSRYGSVLSGQPSFVKRAELGDRGTYYRAMVGPFGSRNEAIQLCTSLKAAGGDCVVQSN